MRIAERKTLKWMCGVTIENKIINWCLKDSIRITSIVDQLKKNIFR